MPQYDDSFLDSPIFRRRTRSYAVQKGFVPKSKSFITATPLLLAVTNHAKTLSGSISTCSLKGNWKKEIQVKGMIYSVLWLAERVECLKEPSSQLRENIHRCWFLCYSRKSSHAVLLKNSVSRLHRIRSNYVQDHVRVYPALVAPYRTSKDLQSYTSICTNLSRYLILLKAKSTLVVVPCTVASFRTIKFNRMHSSRNIHRPNAIDVSGISVRVIKLGITAL